MNEEVFKIITEYMSGERLDKIVVHTNEYQKSIHNVKVLSSKLNGFNFSQEALNILEEYTEALNKSSCIYSQIAYQQGMKDLAAFIISLIPSDK